MSSAEITRAAAGPADGFQAPPHPLKPWPACQAGARLQLAASQPLHRAGIREPVITEKANQFVSVPNCQRGPAELAPASDRFAEGFIPNGARSTNSS